jgi:hypothetical protein
MKSDRRLHASTTGVQPTAAMRQAVAAALEERAGLLVFLDAEWSDTMRDETLALVQVCARIAAPLLYYLVSPMCVRAGDATDCDRTVIREAHNLEEHRGLQTPTE